MSALGEDLDLRHKVPVGEQVPVSRRVARRLISVAAPTACREASSQRRPSYSDARSCPNGGKRVRTTARHAVETTEGYVHSKPWPAIGIAAAAGAAIAAIIGARMQR